jgi:hypothetical protein
VIGGERKNRLVAALSAAYATKDLTEVVELVDPALLVHVNWDQPTYHVVTDILDAAAKRGGPAWIEGVVRSARRLRPNNADLASHVLSCWPYARGLAPALVDNLVAALGNDGITFADVQAVIARLGKSFELLRSDRGREAMADLVERLAGHCAKPGEPLLLLRVVSKLRSERRPVLDDWWQRVYSADAHGSVDIPKRRDGTQIARAAAIRMLIVLLPEDNDSYSFEVFLSDVADVPRSVAVVDRACKLADIPARLGEQLVPGTPLFEAMYASNIEQIDVALPLRDMLAAVDEWTLHGRVLSIGRAYRVVVRCLERNLPRSYPDFFLAFRTATKMWREIADRGHGRSSDDGDDAGTQAHAGNCLDVGFDLRCADQCDPATLRERGLVRWFEAAEQLTPDNVRDALGHHAMMKWLVAAVCTDAPAAAHREALEMMIREGVAAALWVRSEAPAAARPLLEPVCAQLLRLPRRIQEHRNAEAKLPVTLLWDDQDFRPEKWDE